MNKHESEQLQKQREADKSLPDGHVRRVHLENPWPNQLAIIRVWNKGQLILKFPMRHEYLWQCNHEVGLMQCDRIEITILGSDEN